jgi:3-hydroxybutyryl-CoA dehydrogenase
MSKPSSASEAPSSVVLFGAGTMGSGMAVAFARAGCRVRIVARRHTSLELGRRRMAAAVAQLDEEGLLNGNSPEEVLDRVSDHDEPASVDLAADLIIETIAEDLSRKRELLGQIEERAPETAIVASNTSSLSLRDLSEGLRRPRRFAGYHWFNPAELVELVEVVAAPETERPVIDTLVRWSKGIGKRPVVLSREIEGYVANRLQYALIREAYALVEKGVCTPEDVDEVVKAGLGPRWAAVGPFETMDLAGLDVHAAVARDLWPKLSVAAEPPQILKELIASGALGVKSGLGLRGRYEDEAIAALMRRRARVLATLSRIRAEG